MPEVPTTEMAATQPQTESERYASEQSAPTEEEAREAGEFKYPKGLVQEAD